MAYNSESYRHLPLLPYRFRYAGYLLILLSFGAAYLYFRGGRPSFFEVPVFAVITSYSETRWFVFAQTNMLDEMGMVFAVLALLFIGFSREYEESNVMDSLRGKAFLYAAYLTAVIWIFLYLTIFGWPMIVVSATIFLLFMAIYILTFQLLKRNFRARTNQYNKYDRKSGVL